MSELERITARRSELDALAEELGKQLQEVQAEREELVIAERSCCGWPIRVVVPPSASVLARRPPRTRRSCWPRQIMCSRSLRH